MPLASSSLTSDASEKRARLGEVLLGEQLLQLQRLFLLQIRRHLARLLLVLFFLALGVERRETGKFHRRARGAQCISPRLDVDAGDVEHLRLHLRGDEALPDDVV